MTELEIRILRAAAYERLDLRGSLRLVFSDVDGSTYLFDTHGPTDVTAAAARLQARGLLYFHMRDGLWSTTDTGYKTLAEVTE